MQPNCNDVVDGPGAEQADQERGERDGHVLGDLPGLHQVLPCSGGVDLKGQKKGRRERRIGNQKPTTRTENGAKKTQATHMTAVIM